MLFSTIHLEDESFEGMLHHETLAIGADERNALIRSPDGEYEPSDSDGSSRFSVRSGSYGRAMPTIQQQAKIEAERMLATVWAKGSPTVPFPVDPVRIAHRLGVDVYERPLDPNVSGAIVKEPDRDPTILLNQSDSPSRQRFTCAHELGHFVRRSAAPDDSNVFEYVDFRGPLATAGLDDEEMFANAFAANLLMPEAIVREKFRAGKSPVELAFELGVSTDAMTVRLKTLGLL